MNTMLLRALAVCAACVGPAAAAGLDGSYAMDCRNPSDTVMEILGQIARFHESECLLTNPVAVRDMGGAVLFDAQCAGEGETWTDRMMLMPGFEGGIVRVGPGFAVTYARCR
jgi:hypothetical protein